MRHTIGLRISNTCPCNSSASGRIEFHHEEHEGWGEVRVQAPLHAPRGEIRYGSVAESPFEFLTGYEHMRTRKTLACLAIILWCAFSAGAVPVLPEGPKLTVEQLSLRGLDNLRLEVTPVTSSLRKAGVRDDLVMEIYREEITASGINVVDDPDAPLARLAIMGARDPDQPGALAVTFVFAFHQDILLKRVDAHIKAPTAFFAQTKLTTMPRARDVVAWETREMTQRVVGMIRHATDRKPK